MKAKPVNIKGKKYHPVVARIMMIHESCDAPEPKAVEISVEKTEETEMYIDVKATVSVHVELNGTKELTSLKYTDMAREYFEEKQGKRTPVNFAHALENASTSAIGRALRNAGFPGEDELIDEATGEISHVETSISAEEAVGIDRKNKAKASQVSQTKDTGRPTKQNDGSLSPADAIENLEVYSKAPHLNTYENIIEAINKTYGDQNISERAVKAWNSMFYDSTKEGSVEISYPSTVKEVIEISRGHETKMPLHCFRNWTMEEVKAVGDKLLESFSVNNL